MMDYQEIIAETVGFEHHVAINPSQTASALNEALGKYMDWDVYHHEADDA